MTLLVENRDLLGRFRQGESAAMMQVFTHYAPQVASLLRRGFTFAAGEQRVRFSGYAQIFDVEDCLQEIFRRAFSERARSRYDGLRPFSSYIITIAKNVVINEYQARKRALANFHVEEKHIDDVVTDEWSAHDDVLVDAPNVPTGRPEQDSETAELRGLIVDFRKTLNEREQAVFHWRFEESLSQAEMETRTQLTASKIKTTESKIRDRLRKFLQRHGYLAGTNKESGASLRPIEGERS